MKPPKVIKQYSDMVVLLNQFIKDMDGEHPDSLSDDLKKTYHKSKKLLEEMGELWT